MNFFVRSVLAVIGMVVGINMSMSGPVRAAPEWTRLGFEKNWRDNWTEVTFPDKKSTSYSYDTATQSVCAQADRSASAWVRSLSDRDTVPTKIRWEWRVDSVLSEGNARKKSGDDYAARVYVNFEAAESLSYWDRIKLNTFETIYGQDIPSRSVNFIWSNRLDRGTILPSPYTKYTRLVALRNHESPTGTWQRETVDLKKYYRRIFNEDYIRPHSVSIMTDTDDTESTVRGCYRNLAVQ